MEKYPKGGKRKKKKKTLEKVAPKSVLVYMISAILLGSDSFLCEFLSCLLLGT